MLPLLTFAAGVLAGASVVRMLRSEKARAGFEAAGSRLREAATASRGKAQSGLDAAESQLRDAAIAGLAAVERSSAKLRGKLDPKPRKAPRAARKSTRKKTP